MENENERPLKLFSEAELEELWRKAVSVERVTHETFSHISPYYDPLLTGNDVLNVRAGLLVQFKLCQEYGIPYPKLGEFSLSLGGMEFDIETGYGDYGYFMGYDCPVEAYQTDLHDTMDRFTSIHGIGDFVEDTLYVSHEVLGLFSKNAEREGGKKDKIEIPKDMREYNRVKKAMSYKGYRSIMGEIACNGGEDCFDIYELSLFKSKKMAFLHKQMDKGLLPAWVAEMIENFDFKVGAKSYYWIPADDLMEIRRGTWYTVSAIVNCNEEGLLNCSLYKYTSVRVGAYILQELADRYMAAA